jgi:hypothetical protein
MKQDHISNHESIRRARHKLLRSIHREIREAIDAEVGEKLQRIRPLQSKFSHVIRLIEEHTRLLPSPLLVAPVGEFGRDTGVNVGADLLVVQEMRDAFRTSEHCF